MDEIQLAEWIKQLRWRSVEKDNMEFEVRVTCFVKDALDRYATRVLARQLEFDI